MPRKRFTSLAGFTVVAGKYAILLQGIEGIAALIFC